MFNMAALNQEDVTTEDETNEDVTNEDVSTEAFSDDYLEPTFDLVCEPCDVGGDTVEAKGFCQDCRVFLCEGCYRYHRRLPMSQNHVLLDQDAMPKHREPTSIEMVDTCTEKCTEHDGEIIKYYCSNHGQLGCSVCVTLDHRTCDIVYIPKCAKNINNDKLYIDFKEKLEELNKKSKNFATNAHNGLKKVNDLYKELLLDVANYRKQINETLDKLEVTIKIRVENIKAEDTKKMEASIKTSKSVVKELQTLNVQSEQLATKKQYCALFIRAIRAKSTIANIEMQLAEQEHAGLITTEYKFVQSHLQQLVTQLLDTGRIRVKKDLSQIRCDHLSSITVRASSHINPCNISGFVMLPDHNLVTVYSDSNNCNVKVINTCQGTVAQEIQLSSWLHDVTLFQTNRLAVTQPDGKKIAFLCFDDTGKLKFDKEIQMGSVCWGIASVQDKLVVTLKDPSRIECIDDTGEMLQSFTKDDKGEDLFSDPRNVAISSDGQTIYVSDHDKHTVISLDLDGRVRANYTDEELSGPSGIIVDTFDTVYVCGHYSHNVHVLTPELVKVRILLQKHDGLFYPVSLYLCEDTDTLYIGMWDSKEKVFKLS